MPFNKEEQRARAAEFEKQKMGRGLRTALPHLNNVTPAEAVVRGPNPKMDKFMKSVNSSPAFKEIPKIEVAAKKPKQKKLNYLQEPFTNDLGQVINPGQKVVCVTQGYNHRVNTYIGMYLGFRKDWNDKVRNVVVSRQIEKGNWFKNGEILMWGETEGAVFEKRKYTKTASLPGKRIFPTA